LSSIDIVARFPSVTDGPDLVEVNLPGLQGFRKAVHTVFRVGGIGADPVELTLSEVDERPRHPEWESFSLIFCGAAGALDQGLHPVDHADLGSFPLFLVPVVGEADGQLYEAVFNRPTS
jgi:hypothetical protein